MSGIKNKNNTTNMNLRSNSVLFVAVVVVLGAGVLLYGVTLAFQGPNSSAGVGGGAIGVDSSNDVSIGTSTPPAATKFAVVGSSTNATEYALKILQPGGTILVAVQNNGNVGIGTSQPSSTLHVVGSGTITGAVTLSGLGSSGNPCLSVSSAGLVATTTCGGGGTVAASAVTAGVFGSGNFAFPSSLGVNTSTQVSLPANFAVYGTAQTTATTTLAINGGNVGIGTSTPGNLLVASKDQNAGTYIDATNYSNGAQASANVRVVNDAGTQAFLGIYSSGNGPVGALGAGNPYVYTTATGLTLMANNGSGVIKFATGGINEKVRIDASGNVGIGTLTPGNMLDINKASVYGIYLDNSGTLKTILGQAFGASDWAPGSAAGDFVVRSQGGNILFSTDSGATTQMYLKNGGNVGIGTTGPSYKLDVSGDIHTTGTMYGSVNGNITSNSIYMVGSFYGPAAINAWSQGSVFGSPAGSYTSPTPSNTNLVLYDNSASNWAGIGSDTSGDMYFTTGTSGVSTRLIIQPSGYVGIGGASSHLLQLASDDAYKPNGGSWGNSSDARLKTNVVPVTDALAKLTQLQGVTYDWINPSLHGNETSTGGFIAQQVAQVFPDFVSQAKCTGADCALVGSDGKEYGLSLPFTFDAYVVESIKELNNKVDAGKTTFGTAVIKAGSNSVSVTFATPYSTIPEVTATAEGVPTFLYGTTGKSVNGFTITADHSVSHDTSFDWAAGVGQ